MKRHRTAISPDCQCSLWRRAPYWRLCVCVNVLKVEEEMANIKKNQRDMPAGKTVLCKRGLSLQMPVRWLWVTTTTNNNKKFSFHLNYSFHATNPVCSFIIWGTIPVFPTAHSRMALKLEPWMVQETNEWDDEVQRIVMEMAIFLRTQGRSFISRRLGQGEQVGASHLVKKHH